MKYKSVLDKEFSPVILGLNDFLKAADRPVGVMVEDAEGYNFRFDMKAGNDDEKNYLFIERVVKSLLWIVGGHKVYIAGADDVAARLAKSYCGGGARVFDAEFMAKIYGKPFEVVACKQLPQE